MKIFKACSVLLLIFVFIFVSCDAIKSPAELYWKLKLGNIIMPKVLKNSLEQGSNDGTLKVDPQDQVHLNIIGTRSDDDYSYVVYTQSTHILEDGKIDYGNKVPEDVRVVYFTYDKLSTSGLKMKLLFSQIDDGAKFLPLHITKSLAAASNKLQLILNVLSINPKSIIAKGIENTFKECSRKGVTDEVRYCATSLEELVDSIESSSKLEKNELIVASTEEENNVVMEYTIQKTRKLGNDDNHNMVCHKLSNLYAVFLCHIIKSTDVYEVSLIRANGEKTKAVAVCHKDTSLWNPRHLAFQLLKIEPGSKPICHFVNGDTIAWLQN